MELRVLRNLLTLKNKNDQLPPLSKYCISLKYQHFYLQPEMKIEMQFKM